MTATDELCKMLDERGVKHTDAEDGHTQYTWWSDGDHEIAACNSGERLAVYNLTPEQAIAATLGPGTCRLIDTQFPTGDDSYFKACSGCGFWIHNRYSWKNTRFCPHCGRKVVGE